MYIGEKCLYFHLWFLLPAPINSFGISISYNTTGKNGLEEANYCPPKLGQVRIKFSANKFAEGL